MIFCKNQNIDHEAIDLLQFVTLLRLTANSTLIVFLAQLYFINLFVTSEPIYQTPGLPRSVKNGQNFVHNNQFHINLSEII